MTHDKAIGRKVLSIQGNVSAANYCRLSLGKSKSPLNHRYLYLQCIGEPGHTFSFLLTVHCNAKLYRMHFSSLHKAVKQTNANTVSYPVDYCPFNKWAILVLDLHELAQ
jgi:hypothetical protein